ncbi:hypothetical protein OCU04_007009 [Sclerotinia nivalis]|uniref:Uncharacterized protein n=1 Tax=Sclerotinia nivalis TaxID=352851 RepID=A0A9X0ALU4_9HELO|nr:hypothetical protein OCU04_007009 [Sclerotinia nivalis]
MTPTQESFCLPERYVVFRATLALEWVSTMTKVQSSLGQIHEHDRRNHPNSLMLRFPPPWVSLMCLIHDKTSNCYQFCGKPASHHLGYSQLAKSTAPVHGKNFRYDLLSF